MHLPPIRLRSGLTLMCLCLALPGAPAHADPDPAWSFQTDQSIRWFRIIGEWVVVGTDNAMIGVATDSGTVVWRLDGLQPPDAGDVEVLPGFDLAVVSVRRADDLGSPHCGLMDLRSGRELWGGDSLGVVVNRGAFLLPGDRGLLLYGELAARGKPSVLYRIDLCNGTPVWSDPGFQREYRPHLLPHWGRETLRGNQGPLLDSDSTAILFMTRDLIRKIDLASGRTIWERDNSGSRFKFTDPTFADRPAPAPQLGYARMVLASDSTRFFAPHQNKVWAFRVSDGGPVWRKPARLRGRPITLREVPGGILTLAWDSDSDPKGGTLTLLDAATGEIRWTQPGGKSLFTRAVMPRWKHMSRPLVVGDRAIVVAEGELKSIDLASGASQTLAELGFQGDEEELVLERTTDGFRVMGVQDLALFDASGKRTAHLYRQPPSGAGLGLALLGASAMLGAAGAMQVGSGTIELGVDPRVGLNELTREYTATRRGVDYLFMMAEVGPDHDRPGLVRVSKADCQVTHEFALPSKRPEYGIDASGRIILRLDERTLQGFRF